jgi:7-cyano-7-deazaguanine reductase
LRAQWLWKNGHKVAEVKRLTELGYLADEIAPQFGVSAYTINVWRHRAGIQLDSNTVRWARRQLDLPPLNHKVVSVTSIGRADAYDMEVEDTHCFFANEVVVHNCPVTGQPDFAHLVIDYLPGQYLLESKSLKLYLFAYRNHGAFHEDCTLTIATDIVAAVKPQWLRIGAYWYARGGIPIEVFWQTGPTPEDLWIPEQGVQPYRGRG